MRGREVPVMRRRRRPFGLDPVRRADPVRVEAEVLAWLAEAVPDAVPLRVSMAGDDAPALALLRPGGPAALLRIDTGPPVAGGAAPLAVACRRCRVPFATLRHAGEARAALRGFGIEVEPRREDRT